MTLEQAKLLNCGDILHEQWGPECRQFDWKVNGKVKTWKRDPYRVEIPLKRGSKRLISLYDYGRITEWNLHMFHLAADCPTEKKTI